MNGPRADALQGSKRRDSMQNQEEPQAPCPELRKHLRAIQKDGNRIDRLWMEDERFDEIVSLCATAESHLASAREAAFRRDRALLRGHLTHARNGFRLALQTFSLLPSDMDGPA